MKIKLPFITPPKKNTLLIAIASGVGSIPFACFTQTIYLAYFLLLVGFTTSVSGSLVKKF